MGQRNYIKMRGYIDSPLGKNSLFYNFYDDPVGLTFPDDETPPEDKYTYTIIVCESGLEVFEKYSSNQYQPKPKHIYIFIEKQNTGKNNFFGTACRVKMGEERKELMRKLYDEKTKVSINDSTALAKNLNDWAEDIAYFNKRGDIDKVALLNAVKLELSNKSDANKIFQALFGLNDELADWIRSGIGVMDEWKFTEENYEFKKYGTKLKPIISVNFFSKASDYYVSGNVNKIIIKDTGLNVLTRLSEHLDQAIFNKAFVLAQATPFVHDDILFGSVWFIKEFLEKSLPESLKAIFTKLKAIIAQVEGLMEKIGKEVEKLAATLNAFLCGLANGFISLLQTIVGLVAYIIDKLPFFEFEEVSKEKLAEHQKKLEFIEDLIDLVQENIAEIFNGLLKSIKTLGEDLNSFIGEIGQKISNLSRYWWAYIIGALALELIIDSILAFFTGGSSAAASTATKITRLSSQLAKKGIKVAKTGAKKIAASTNSLYSTVKKFFEELIEALKSGKFMEWLKKKFFELTGDVTSLRKLNLAKWIHKFNKSFFNHIDGEAGITRIEKGFFKSEYIEWGQGGHNAQAFKKSIRRRPYTKFDPNPPIDDLPFKAEIDVLYRGYWLPKQRTSSMFPENWKLERIKEEIAWVYENTVAKGVNKKRKSPTDIFDKYEGATTSGFKIRLEIDSSNNIMNAYPIIQKMKK